MAGYIGGVLRAVKHRAHSWAWCPGTVPACACTAFWAVLAAPVHMIDGRLREVRVARSIVVVLEVREPAGGRERARYNVVPGVPLLPNFGIVRRRGRGFPV